MSGRKRLIGTSLKMYMGLARTREWITGVADIVRKRSYDDVDLFVIPNFLSIPDTRNILQGTGIALGAQDVFWEDTGPYTGEISAPMLRDAGCRYVEIGHIERRRIFGETDEIVSRKMQAAVRAGLTPILCVGESRRGRPEEAVDACAIQLAVATQGLPTECDLVIAWEPIWAIGAPEPAPDTYIAAVARGLREILTSWPGSRLIYGGSAGPGLLTRLGDAVDGLFLGRFVHDVNNFREVMQETLQGHMPDQEAAR